MPNSQSRQFPSAHTTTHSAPSEREREEKRKSQSMRTSALLASDPGAGASRVRSSGGSVGIPAVVYYLMALCIALPTLSFFAMHSRMLDRQEVLSRNFASTMAELTTVRRDVGEMKAIKSELTEARTELLLARLSLKEVSDRLGGGASNVGVTSGGYHVQHRRLLRGEVSGSSGVGGGSSSLHGDDDVDDTPR